jgi:protein O-GlcNAc transferase
MSEQNSSKAEDKQDLTVDEAFIKAGEYFNDGYYTEADQFCTAIVQADPNHVYAINLLGLVAQKLNRHDLAVEQFQKAININDNIALFYYNLGTSLYPLGRIDEVIKAQKQAVAINSTYAEAYSSMGNAFTEIGEMDEGLWCLQKAIEIKPDFADAYSNIGNTLLGQGKLQEAVDNYKKSLTIKPDSIEAYSNLGVALKEQGKFEEAIVIYKKTLSIRPDFAEVYTNLGNIYKDQGRLEEAVIEFQKAISLKPDIPEAYYNLGITRHEQNKLDEAVFCYNKAISIDPNFILAHTNLIYCTDLYSDVKTDLFMTERKKWNRQFAEPLRKFWQPFPNNQNPDKKLRIGYVGAYFKLHSAANMFGPVVINHDLNQFEIFCYVGKNEEDVLTNKLRDKATKWLQISQFSDEKLDEQIRKDRIDILIDLAGHMDGNRLLTYARKPAPIQISAWGYPFGTGMAAMDYIFADPIGIPLSDRPMYTEKIIDLSCLAHFNLDISYPDVSHPPVCENNHITFGAFNRLEKNIPAVYSLWAELLHRIPNAKLLIKEKKLDLQKNANEIQDFFQSKGILPDRLILLGGTTPFEHLKAHEKIDIMLDPFPQTGGMTTLESLWMGVPVLTCENKTRLRTCASILHILELDDWRASDEQDFLEIAVRFANDIGTLKTLRQQLRNRFKKSILGNSQLYAKEVETNYRQLWKKWCEHQSTKK